MQGSDINPGVSDATFDALSAVPHCCLEMTSCDGGRKAFPGKK